MPRRSSWQLYVRTHDEIVLHLRKGFRGLLPLFVTAGAFLAIGSVLITTGVLPEERAQHFRSLTDVSIATGTILNMQM